MTKRERKRRGSPLRVRLEEALHFRPKTVDELAASPAFSNTTVSSIKATLYRHRPDFDREPDTGRWYHTRKGGWTPWTDKDRPVRADDLTDLKCFECGGARFLVRLAERSRYTPCGQLFELCCASCHEVYEFSFDEHGNGYRVATRNYVGVVMFEVYLDTAKDRFEHRLIYERRWDEPEDDYDTVWAAKKAQLARAEADAEAEEEMNQLAEAVGLEPPFPRAPAEKVSDRPFASP